VIEIVMVRHRGVCVATLTMCVIPVLLFIDRACVIYFEYSCMVLHIVFDYLFALCRELFVSLFDCYTEILRYEGKRFSLILKVSMEEPIP